MKLSKTVWLILGIGIFVIAVGSLYMVSSQQAREQEQLNTRLLVTQATLPKVVSEKENRESQLTQLESELTQLEGELTQATSLLAESKMSFPESVESIEYDERLFKFADDWDLEIISLTASEPLDEVVEGITFPVTSFEVDVKGELADILDFINAIVADKDFLNATVELVNIDAPEPPVEEEEKSSATITLVIYGYEGE